ncbi:MAG: hypothetical protein WCQ53_00685 [bacterium]
MKKISILVLSALLLAGSLTAQTLTKEEAKAKLETACKGYMTLPIIDELIKEGGALEVAVNSSSTSQDFWICDEVVTDIYSSGLVLENTQSLRIAALYDKMHIREELSKNGSLDFSDAYNSLERYINRTSYTVDKLISDVIDVLLGKAALTGTDYLAMLDMNTVLKAQFCPIPTAAKFAGITKFVDAMAEAKRVDPAVEVRISEEMKTEMKRARFQLR